MKKIPNWIIVIVVIALLIGSKFLFFADKEEGNMMMKNKGKFPSAVNYFVVQKTSIDNNIFATGKIGSMNQIEVIPEISGKVISIFFKEGETVLKGNNLIKINDADFQAQLLKSKSQISLSEQKLERLKKLLAINGVSQEEYDMQQNELNTLKADQAYILAQIAKTNVVAPFTGVIGLKNISEGSFVNTSTSIASLVQIKPTFVEFSVPEKYTELFKKGIEINFSNENISNEKQHKATIYAIEPKVDETTKTIKARAIYNGDDVFYPGTFVKVFVNMQKTENTLMIPTECIIPTLKGQKIFISKNNTAVESQVTIGMRTDSKIQILSGVNEGDTVITSGLLSIKKESSLKLLKQVN